MKHIKVYEELIPGGKASGMTIGQIADSHGVDLKDIQRQFAVGIEVEMEHTTSRGKAEEIAMDHISEDPHYYTRLIRGGFVDEPKALKKYKEMFEGDWFDSHPDNPANQEDPYQKMEIEYSESKTKFTLLYNIIPAGDFGILKGKPEVGGGVWLIRAEDLDNDYKLCTHVGDDDWECEIVDESLVNYATDLWDNKEWAEGEEAYEDGEADLIRIDEAMREGLMEDMERMLKPSHRSYYSPRFQNPTEILKRAIWEFPKMEL
jgi:hypothetical protein